ncbi:MAG: hypothetical protein WCG98_07260 [bacterium]
MDIIILAFIVCFVLLLLSGITLDIYLNSLFGTGLLTMLSNA